MIHSQLKCTQATHQDKPIDALCLRQDCEINSACCIMCIQLHPNCVKHLKYSDQIPDAIQDLKKLRDWFKETFEQFKQLIAKSEKILIQHFLPIDEYSASPTLTNFNKIGQILRSSQLDLEQEKQNICQNLEKFKDILLNKDVQQMKKQIDKVVLSDEDEEKVRTYYQEGEKLWDENKYEQAITSFNKVLEIDKEHLDALHCKGYALHSQKKFEEAIKCFEKCIEIDSQKYDSYLLKGCSLQAINKHEEAIKSIDQQIKQNPKYYILYGEKAKSLLEISRLRLKEAERCYIEGLKLDSQNVDFKNSLQSVHQQLMKLK